MADQSALVIDDHPLVAKGIADFVRAVFGFSHVHIAPNADAVWPLLTQHTDVVIAIVDFWLPQGASLDVLARLRLDYPHIPILVTSADDNPLIQQKSCEAGAAGFIHKQDSTALFVQAVTAILQQQRWFRDTRHVQHLREIPIAAADLGLTVRQGEVLSMMLQGLPNKRIARQLDVSEATVKEHVSGILERLGARNRIELITRWRGRKLQLLP